MPEPPSDPASAQFQLFDAYVRFMQSVAADAPLLLVLDDLHWADKPSLLLLQHLARELAHLPILVVGTYRDTDLVRTHPLSESLAALNRDPGFTRLPLRGLSDTEVAQYIRTAANVEPDPPLLARIVEETEGNPFFLAEVVNLLTEEGRLARGHSAEFAVPEGVREALGRRLDRLSEDANVLLATAAIVGPRVSLRHPHRPWGARRRHAARVDRGGHRGAGDRGDGAAGALPLHARADAGDLAG